MRLFYICIFLLVASLKQPSYMHAQVMEISPDGSSWTDVPANNAVSSSTFSVCTNTHYHIRKKGGGNVSFITTANISVISTDNTNSNNDWTEAVIMFNSSGNFQVDTDGGTNADNSYSLIFTITESPDITLSNTSDNLTAGRICEGENIEVTASCTGGSTSGDACNTPFSYAWDLHSSSSGSIETSTNPGSFTSSTSADGANTWYWAYVTVTNGNSDVTGAGCIDSTSIKLELDDTTDITGLDPFSNANTNNCPENLITVTATCDNTNGACPTTNGYVWEFDDDPLFGSVDFSSTDDNSIDIPANTFSPPLGNDLLLWTRATVTSDAGCTAVYTSQAADFTINPTPVVSPTTDPTFCEGEPIAIAILNCDDENNGDPADECEGVPGNNYTSYRVWAVGENQSAADSIPILLNGSPNTDFENRSLTPTDRNNFSMIASITGLNSGDGENTVTYWVEVTNSSGCVGIAQNTVEVIEAPTISIAETAPYAVCQNNTPLQLNASCTGHCPGTTSYTWTDATYNDITSSCCTNNTFNTVGTYPDVSVVGTTSYALILEDGTTNCVDTLDFDINVVATPNPNLVTTGGSGANSVCSGSTITIEDNSTTGALFEFFDSDPQSGSPTPLQSSATPSYVYTGVSSTVTSTETIYFRSSVGSCETFSSIDIDIYQSPSAIINGPTLFCNTVVPSYSSVVTGGASNYSYAWTSSTGIPSSSSSWDNLTTPADGAYSVSLTVSSNHSGGLTCPSSEVVQSFTVTDCGAVTLNKQRDLGSGLVPIVDDRVCLGDEIKFEVVGQSPSFTYSYEWDTGSDTLSSLTKTVDENSPDTIFTRLIVSYYGENTISYICGYESIDISDNIISILTNIVQNEVISLSNDTYQFNDPGALDSIRPPDASSQINYDRFLVPIFCDSTVFGKIIILDVVDETYVVNPEAEVIPYQDTSICLGDELDISVRCPNCFPDLTYTYNDNTVIATPVSDETAFENATFITTEDTVLQVYIVDNYLCKDTVSRRITVKPNPGLSLDTGYETEFCPSNSATVSAIALPNTTFEWNTGQNAQSISINSSGTYVVTATLNGCVDTTSVIASQFALPTLAIRTMDGIAITSSYYLCGPDIDSIQVDTNSCLGCNFTWNNGQNDPILYVNSSGGYYVNAIDPNGCEVVSNPILIIQSLDGYNQTPVAAPAEICGINPATLEVPPCNGCSYEWYHQYPNTGGTIVLDSLESDTRIVDIDDPGDYYAVTTNSDGCQFNSSVINVTENNVVIPDIFSNTDSICSNSQVRFWTTSNDTFSYQWYLDGNIISGANDSVYIADQTGDYEVLVTYENGCQEFSVAKTIYPSTFAPTISSPAIVICNNDSITVSVDGSLVGGSFQWYVNGNAISANGNSSKYEAKQAGVYYAVVTDSNQCTAITGTIELFESDLNNPNAFTFTPLVCPSDSGRLSVSLSPGAKYQWFNLESGSPISANAVNTFNINDVTSASSGIFNYWVEIEKDGCIENSDTVQIEFAAVVVPSIIADAAYVCTGVTPTITTSNCPGCNFSWLLNGLPVLGALNDTFHTVTNINKTGNYQVAVEYNNGCRDTSANLLISDGSFNLTLGNAVGADPVICNGQGEDLEVNFSGGSGAVGNPLYTLFRDNSAVTGYIGVTNNVFTNLTNEGFYTVRMVDPLGCEALSNAFELIEIDIAPVLESRATSDPNSFTPVTAICGPDGTAFLEVFDCDGCTFEWQKNATLIPGYGPGSPSDTFTTSIGPAGQGVYVVIADSAGCVQNTNVVSINSVAALDTATLASKLSICDGETVTLEYANLSNCVGCNFRWLRSLTAAPGVPVNGANNPSFVTNTSGNYTLEITDPGNGCVDTSSVLPVIDVLSPPGFSLNLDSTYAIIGKGTPQASSAPAFDLNGWVRPVFAQMANTGATDAYFTSAPYNGALPPDAGLSGVGNEIFTPTAALTGFHLVTYNYDTLGCIFQAQDVLEVLPSAGISVFNTYTGSVPYEACVYDTLVISLTNFDYPVDSVWIQDQNGVYNYIDTLQLSLTDSTATFGTQTVHYTTITIVVPPYALQSPILLTSQGIYDTLSPFVLFHNADLQFTGLPNMLCSNGDTLTLTGTPSGGFFSVLDSVGNTLTNMFNGDDLIPANVPLANYVEGGQNIRVVYSYTQSYTNGNLCLSFDTTQQVIESRDVRLTGVDYNLIATSQDVELLTNLVDRVYPQFARANKPNYTVSFNGSFAIPAGNPTTFLAKTAGVGYHDMEYIITTGDCENSVLDSILVIDPPAELNWPDTICSNFDSIRFARDPAYQFATGPGSNVPYSVTGGYTYTDSAYIMRVYSTNNNQAMDTVQMFLNSETFEYKPRFLGDTIFRDTIVVEYVFKRLEDSLGFAFDSLEYVVGKIYKPLVIELSSGVQIDTLLDSVYCEANQLSLLRGIPQTNAFNAGYFTLTGGNYDYATGDTLLNNVINPFDVHKDEVGDTYYSLVYHLNGAVCSNTDTMRILIPERINTDFATSTGEEEFCDSDGAVQIINGLVNDIALGIASDTAIFKVGGVPQSTFEFRPTPLDTGLQVVELIAFDTFGCSYSTKDTFIIHPLPTIFYTNTSSGALLNLDNKYCTNDDTVRFVVNPGPYCADFDTTQFVLDNDFSLGIPTSWTREPGGVFSNTNPNWTLPSVGGYLNTAAVQIDTFSQLPVDAWLITDGFDLIAGNEYELTFLIKVDSLVPTTTDSRGKIEVLMGIGNTSADLTVLLVTEPFLDNDGTFVPVTSRFTAPSSNTWYLGLHSFNEQNARRILLDNLRIRDVTDSYCQEAGIGYVTGPGIYNVQDSLYEFNPAAIDPGFVEVKYLYTNIFGCTDSLVYPMDIFEAPEVTMTDIDDSYCDNLPAEIMYGIPAGGVFSNSINGNLSNLDQTGDGQFDPVFYTPTYGGFDTIVYTYVDPLSLCDAQATQVVQVYQITDTAEITFINQAYHDAFGFCENADSVILDVRAGSMTNGIFEGLGVRFDSLGPGASVFYPQLVYGDSGRYGDVTISYTFQTAQGGCVDTTKVTYRVHKMPDLAFTNLPDSVCANGDTLEIFTTNNVVFGSFGQYTNLDTVLGTWTTDPPNFIGFGNRLIPSIATGFAYADVALEYTDTNFCTVTITDSVRIDTVPEIYFQGIEPFFCENEQPRVVLAYPPYKVGSGYLMIDSVQIDSSFYWLDPAALADPAIGTVVYPVEYTYTDTRNCTGIGFDTFEVRAFPRINFDVFQDSFCQGDSVFNLMTMIPDSINYGYFTDNLALTSIYQDSLLNLTTIMGPRIITYNFQDSITECSNVASDSFFVFSSPDVSFEAFGGCVGDQVLFEGYVFGAESGVDSITSVSWYTEGGTNPGPLSGNPLTIADYSYTYSASVIDTVVLTVINQQICAVTDTQIVIISPSHDLAVSDYFEDFQLASADWYNDQPVDLDSVIVWQYVGLDSAANNIYDPNNKAWVTFGNDGYGLGQEGWIYSPCYDFTASRRPMIAMDMWRNTLDGVDGMVMQYFDVANKSWEVVGTVGKGMNWYQRDFVLSRPGQQPTSVPDPNGWTGDSNGWESSRYRLDQFIGRDNIRFRFAFASSLQSVLADEPEGIAIDNVFVGERTRNILVEHFSNENYQSPSLDSMFVIDSVVYSRILNSYNGRDVYLIQYQTDISGWDLNHNLNPGDPSARIYNYGVTSDNTYLLNGLRKGNAVSFEIAQDSLDYDMLQFPAFDINITNFVIQNGTEVSVTADMIANKDMPNDDYVMHTAILQDQNVFDSDGREKRNVLRKMIPGAAGVSFYQPFTNGQQVSNSATWDFSSFGPVINPTHLQAIVFVQSRSNDTVYQAATTQDLTIYDNTTIIDEEIRSEIVDLKLYPNPTEDQFQIEFTNAIKGDYEWMVVDVLGRRLMGGVVNAGTQQFTVPVDRFAAGTYFFVMRNESVYTQRKVVVRR